MLAKIQFFMVFISSAVHVTKPAKLAKIRFFYGCYFRKRQKTLIIAIFLRFANYVFTE